MLDRMAAIRVVATPEAIDSIELSPDAIAMRLAPDEMLLLEESAVEVPGDEHAIVVADVGWSGVWLDSSTADQFLRSNCQWELPQARPAFAQGMIAHLAVKVWLAPTLTLLLVPTPLAEDLVARLDGAT